jgi:hypothetical protein
VAAVLPISEYTTEDEKKHQGHLYTLIKDMPLKTERLLISRKCILDKQSMFYGIISTTNFG